MVRHRAQSSLNRTAVDGELSGACLEAELEETTRLLAEDGPKREEVVGKDYTEEGAMEDTMVVGESVVVTEEEGGRHQFPELGARVDGNKLFCIKSWWQRNRERIRSAIWEYAIETTWNSRCWSCRVYCNVSNPQRWDEPHTYE